jgi:hypothetical protein
MKPELKKKVIEDAYKGMLQEMANMEYEPFRFSSGFIAYEITKEEYKQLYKSVLIKMKPIINFAKKRLKYDK